MKLNKYKEEVYKCSGCGLCQSVCPIYSILKTESAVSRGKFNLLNAIINKDLTYSQKTLEYMELCLHCQACNEFCPSGINAQKIIETAKSDMLDKNIFNFNKIILANILTNKTILVVIKFLINIIRYSKILSILNILNINQIKLINSFLIIKVKPLTQKSNKYKNIKVLYFKGCINNYINPSCANSVEKILNETDVEIINADFSCCGLPLKSIGDFKKFKKIAQKNLDKINMNFDYLIFDCASCKSTFLEYQNFLDGKYKEKAENIYNKCISIYELLNKINYTKSKNWKQYKITFHYPCHTRGSNEKNHIEKLLQNINNVTYIEQKNANQCCGAAGSFIISHNKLSKQISLKKAENIISTNADIVLTSCPSCILGIKQGLIEKKSNVETMNLIEFLAK